MKLGLLVCLALAGWLSKANCQSYSVKSRSDCCGSYAPWPGYADWAFYKINQDNEYAKPGSSTKCKREHSNVIEIAEMVEKNNALSQCMCTSATTKCHENASAATTTTTTTTTQAQAQAGVTTTTTATTTTATTTKTTTPIYDTCDLTNKVEANSDCCHRNDLHNGVAIDYTDEERKKNCCKGKDKKCYCDMSRAKSECDACPTKIGTVAVGKHGCCGFVMNGMYSLSLWEHKGSCCRMKSPGNGATVKPGELLGECHCQAVCQNDDDEARKLCPVPTTTTSRRKRAVAGAAISAAQKGCRGAVQIYGDPDQKNPICNGVLSNIPGLFEERPELPSVIFLKDCIDRLKSEKAWKHTITKIKVKFLGSAATEGDFDDVFQQVTGGKDFGNNNKLVALLPKPAFFDDITKSTTAADCPACVFNKALMEEHLGTDCIVVTWGSTSDAPAALISAPLHVEVEKQAESACAALNPPAGSDCWGITTPTAAKSCEGDQGAPVLCKLEPTSELVLVGVVNAISPDCKLAFMTSEKVSI